MCIPEAADGSPEINNKRNMKRIFLFLICGLSLVAVRAQKTIVNDPNAELRPVKGFHAIEVSNAIDLYLSQGDKETVAVSASEIKWRDQIRTEVKDGVLKIYLNNEGWHWNTGGKKLKAYVSFTGLDK